MHSGTRAHQGHWGAVVGLAAILCAAPCSRALADEVDSSDQDGPGIPRRSITREQAIGTSLAKNPSFAASVTDVRLAKAHALRAAGIDDLVADVNGTWLRSRQELAAGTLLGQPRSDDLSLA